METILVSACLLGDKTRYDGKDNYNEKVEFLKEHFNIVPICPEVMGGLSTPRYPSEIKNGSVIDKNGRDVTRYFEEGAKQVINIVKYLHIKKAVLVDGSPSCGINEIHNGNFNNVKIKGQGITARELEKNGVMLFTIDNLDGIIDKTLKEIDAERQARFEEYLHKND